MRVLTVPPAAAGHVSAMIPMCWALRAAGHEVLVAGQPDTLPVARTAGLNVAEIGDPAALTGSLGSWLTPDMFPLTVFGERDTGPGREAWSWTARERAGHAETHLDAYVALGRAWGADLVLGEPLAVVSRVLAAVLGVPQVSLRWGVDPTAGPFEDTVRTLLAPLCARLGLPGLPGSDLLLDPCPPELQAADAPPGHLVQYVPSNGAGLLPDWATGRAGRPRVCVCLGGTVLSLTGPGPLYAVLTALAGVDAEVVLALTPADRAAAGPVPERVRVVESLPLNLFLGSCDLLIHHGGSGTGLTGTRYGVPQLVLPQFFDEFDYGTRLAEAGAGITVADRAGQHDAGGLADAITRLLGDRAFRDSATRLRDRMRDTPSQATAVPLIENLVRSPALTG